MAKEKLVINLELCQFVVKHVRQQVRGLRFSNLIWNPNLQIYICVSAVWTKLFIFPLCVETVCGSRAPEEGPTVIDQ